ncbi:hypothetical protein [Nitratireductor sp. StC3]|uniref:DUF6925 family protein n=1 Tax=Nitratireductor sp. StC3 TaxID=2126741 RepID=UPI000D0CC296|nr:hypothetical protein [Nitratireductor sp. StC3]PSM16510.1 hypothetical protein C7T96_19470 [Nitratireductor sp. StC3]
MNDLENLLRRALADWQCGWSMGTFGAIAEFHHDDGETTVVDDPATLTRATARGGIALDRAALAAVVPVAYETLSPKRHRWSHALALCLPQTAARRACRATLSELGPDDGAIREADRGAILFDMGLSLPQSDFCIRTRDAALLAVLRSSLGRSLLEPGNPAMAAILSAHPHRVAVTGIGRVEVYQKIGGPDTGGVSPPGPHTHVLPKLLKSGRTHSANTPIPDGLMPLAALHPGHPVIGPLGEDRAFDATLDAGFQALLTKYGLPEAVAEKNRLLTALSRGEAPDEFTPSETRLARSALRLALRQEMHRCGHRGEDARLRLLTQWQARFEPAADDEAEDDRPGH